MPQMPSLRCRSLVSQTCLPLQAGITGRIARSPLSPGLIPWDFRTPRHTRPFRILTSWGALARLLCLASLVVLYLTLIYFIYTDSDSTVGVFPSMNCHCYKLSGLSFLNHSSNFNIISSIGYRHPRLATLTIRRSRPNRC